MWTNKMRFLVHWCVFGAVCGLLTLSQTGHSLDTNARLQTQTDIPAEWSPWSTWSPCSSDCGAGISERKRECRPEVMGTLSILYGMNAGDKVPCKGKSVQRKLCQQKACPPGQLSPRHVACSAYNKRVFSGRQYVWEPFMHPTAPCKLSCRAKNVHFYANLADRVKDGTPCGRGQAKAVCVRGACQAVGCDDVIGSQASMDRCGQCQGDGSSCKVISGIFTSSSLRPGLNHVINIPSGSTSINITELMPSNNLLLLQTVNGKTFINGEASSPTSGDVTAAGTMFTFSGKSQAKAKGSILSKGPTNMTVVLKMLSRGHNPGIMYSISVPQTVSDEFLQHITRSRPEPHPSAEDATDGAKESTLEDDSHFPSTNKNSEELTTVEEEGRQTGERKQSDKTAEEKTTHLDERKLFEKGRESVEEEEGETAALPFEEEKAKSALSQQKVKETSEAVTSKSATQLLTRTKDKEEAHQIEVTDLDSSKGDNGLSQVNEISSKSSDDMSPLLPSDSVQTPRLDVNPTGEMDRSKTNPSEEVNNSGEILTNDKSDRPGPLFEDPLTDDKDDGHGSLFDDPLTDDKDDGHGSLFEDRNTDSEESDQSTSANSHEKPEARIGQQETTGHTFVNSWDSDESLFSDEEVDNNDDDGQNNVEASRLLEDEEIQQVLNDHKPKFVDEKEFLEAEAEDHEIKQSVTIPLSSLVDPNEIESWDPGAESKHKASSPSQDESEHSVQQDSAEAIEETDEDIYTEKQWKRFDKERGREEEVREDEIEQQQQPQQQELQQQQQQQQRQGLPQQSQSGLPITTDSRGTSLTDSKTIHSNSRTFPINSARRGSDLPPGTIPARGTPASRSPEKQTHLTNRERSDPLRGSRYPSSRPRGGRTYKLPRYSQSFTYAHKYRGLYGSSGRARASGLSRSSRQHRRRHHRLHEIDLKQEPFQSTDGIQSSASQRSNATAPKARPSYTSPRSDASTESSRQYNNGGQYDQVRSQQVPVRVRDQQSLSRQAMLAERQRRRHEQRVSYNQRLRKYRQELARRQSKTRVAWNTRAPPKNPQYFTPSPTDRNETDSSSGTRVRIRKENALTGTSIDSSSQGVRFSGRTSQLESSVSSERLRGDNKRPDSANGPLRSHSDNWRDRVTVQTSPSHHRAQNQKTNIGRSNTNQPQTRNSQSERDSDSFQTHAIHSPSSRSDYAFERTDGSNPNTHLVDTEEPRSDTHYKEPIKKSPPIFRNNFRTGKNFVQQTEDTQGLETAASPAILPKYDVSRLGVKAPTILSGKSKYVSASADRRPEMVSALTGNDVPSVEQSGSVAPSSKVISRRILPNRLPVKPALEDHIESPLIVPRQTIPDVLPDNQIVPESVLPREEVVPRINAPSRIIPVGQAVQGHIVRNGIAPNGIPANQVVPNHVIPNENGPNVLTANQIPLNTLTSEKVSRATAYEWRISGLTECTHSCGGGVQQTVVVCVDTLTQAVVTDENCRHIQRPKVLAVTCNKRPCPASWSPGPWSACSVTCGEGEQTRKVTCQARVSPTLNLTMPEDSCGARSDVPDRQICNKNPCSAWKAGNWTQCSAKCGDGVRTRTVVCVDLEGKELDDSQCVGVKPEDEETCRMEPCGRGWLFAAWPEECPVDCGKGRMTRRIICADDTGSSLPDERCDASQKPSTSRICRVDTPCGGLWYTGSWSRCNATCGPGTRSRDVLCVKKLPGGVFAVVGEENCEESSIKPAALESCLLKQCAPKWYMTSWQRCSKTCDTGYRSREVKCVDPDQLPSDKCPLNRRPKTRDVCNTQPCVDVTTQPGKAGEKTCKDNFAMCRVVRRARLCRYSFYKRKCCVSCSGTS